MAVTRECNSAVTAGRLSKAVEFFDAADLLEKADEGFGKHLSALLSLKNKAAYAHQALSTAERKKMNRAASHLVEAAKRAVASAGRAT